MRRILRKIAANEHDQLGDISTLADPSVVDSLVRERMNRPADEKSQRRRRQSRDRRTEEANEARSAARSR